MSNIHSLTLPSQRNLLLCWLWAKSKLLASCTNMIQYIWESQDSLPNLFLPVNSVSAVMPSLFRVSLLLLTLLATVQLASTFHRRKEKVGSTSTQKELCKRERVHLNVSYPGCDSASTKVSICSGSCGSYTYITLFPPYQSSECNVCKSSSFWIGARRLMFNCNGVSKRHKVFLPIIKECACARASLL